jgi:hypothetical protein
MKSKIIFKEQKPFYPRLMISDDERNIVLFSCDGVGTVVWTVDPIQYIGSHFKDFDMEKYREFRNTIELSNY